MTISVRIFSGQHLLTLFGSWILNGRVADLSKSGSRLVLTKCHGLAGFAHRECCPQFAVMPLQHQRFGRR